MSRHDHPVQDQAGGGLIRYARSYEVISKVVFAGRRQAAYDALVRESGAQPDDRILDVGCGTGYLARRAAVAVGVTGTVVGIDPSVPMLDLARRLAPPNCTFTPAGAERLPFPDRSFDRVVSCLAFHHIPAGLRTAAVQEMFRVLRPGGRLLVADFRPPTGQVGRLIGLLTGPAMQHDGIAEVNDAVRGAGFTVTEIGRQRPLLSYLTANRPA